VLYVPLKLYYNLVDFINIILLCKTSTSQNTKSISIPIQHIIRYIISRFCMFQWTRFIFLCIWFREQHSSTFIRFTHIVYQDCISHPSWPWIIWKHYYSYDLFSRSTMSMCSHKIRIYFQGFKQRDRASCSKLRWYLYC
jgi:hypothetical protein